MTDEILTPFKPVVRIAALTAKGAVVSVDPDVPRQLTEDCDKLGAYSVRAFGSQFQIVAEILRTPWTAIVATDPRSLHERRVMPVFLKPMQVTEQ